MVNVSILGGDGIFVEAEIGEACGTEVIQPNFRVVAGDGPAEVFGRAGVIREFTVNVGGGFLGENIPTGERLGGGKVSFGEFGSVFGVEGPLAAES